LPETVRRWYVEITYSSGGRTITHDAVVRQVTAHEAVEYVLLRYYVRPYELILATVKPTDVWSGDLALARPTYDDQQQAGNEV
jgi:hypothetical protein